MLIPQVRLASTPTDHDTIFLGIRGETFHEIMKSLNDHHWRNVNTNIHSLQARSLILALGLNYYIVNRLNSPSSLVRRIKSNYSICALPLLNLIIKSTTALQWTAEIDGYILLWFTVYDFSSSRCYSDWLYSTQEVLFQRKYNYPNVLRRAPSDLGPTLPKPWHLSTLRIRRFWSQCTPNKCKLSAVGVETFPKLSLPWITYLFLKIHVSFLTPGELITTGFWRRGMGIRKLSQIGYPRILEESPCLTLTYHWAYLRKSVCSVYVTKCWRSKYASHNSTYWIGAS